MARPHNPKWIPAIPPPDPAVPPACTGLSRDGISPPGVQPNLSWDEAMKAIGTNAGVI